MWQRKTWPRRSAPAVLQALGWKLAAVGVITTLTGLLALADTLRQPEPVARPGASPLPMVHRFGTPTRPANVHPPRNCTEARAWGLSNIPRGSPYYAPRLDADNDGLGCEPWPAHRRNR